MAIDSAVEAINAEFYAAFESLEKGRCDLPIDRVIFGHKDVGSCHRLVRIKLDVFLVIRWDGNVQTAGHPGQASKELPVFNWFPD